MTIEEAVNELDELTMYVEHAFTEEHKCKPFEALQVAIKALEKQIPKEIKHQGCLDDEGVWRTWNGIDGVPYDLCPNCGVNLCTTGFLGRSKKNINYCERCGQAIKWEC